MHDPIVECLDRPLRLVREGQEFLLAPLGIADRAAIAAEIKSRRLNALFAAVENGRPLPYEIIAKSIADICCTEVRSTELYTTPEGQLMLLWHSAKKHTPSLSLEAVGKLSVVGAESLIRIIDQINLASPGDGSDPFQDLRPLASTPT